MMTGEVSREYHVGGFPVLAGNQEMGGGNPGVEKSNKWNGEELSKWVKRVIEGNYSLGVSLPGIRI